MEEMMREASSEPQHTMAPISSQPFPTAAGVVRESTLTDAQPITRSSLAVLTGDENDLLSESPVFQKAKNASAERSASDLMATRPAAA